VFQFEEDHPSRGDLLAASVPSRSKTTSFFIFHPHRIFAGSGKPMAVWNPRQVAAQNVNRDRSSHEERTNPEAPVTMHAPPVRAGVRLATITAVALMIVPVSRHLAS
jgi:hypothetical protein